MDLNLQAADAYCRRLTQGHYENFIVSSGFLDQATRLDLARFYAYCRTTDDLGDENGAQGLSLLSRWRAEVEALFRGEPPAHPVLLALAQTIARRDLPAQPFLDLISANVQDQTVKVYETWSQLEAYCMLSAAPVGRIVLRIFGLEDDAAVRLSDDVCVGLQLANHAQDVSRDARIGRTYLLAADVREGGVRGAVRAMCERARRLLASGRRLESLAPFILRVQLALYRLGGMAICSAIEEIGYDTETRRPSVGGPARIAIVARAIVEAASQHAVRTGDVEPA